MTSPSSNAIHASSKRSRPEHIDTWFEKHGYEVERPVARYARYNFRKIRNKKTNNEVVVAYKTDRKINETSNVFIETVSVSNETQKTLGWAYDERIQAVVIYSPEAAYFWYLPKETLEANLERWQREYDTRSTKNPTYTTQGIIVPEAELKRCGASRHIL